MRLLFQYFSGGGGGLSNVVVMLKAYAQEFPEDELVILCSEDSELNQLESFSNVNVVGVKRGRFQEVTRLFLGLHGIEKVVKKFNVDIVWSLNLGAYRSLSVPNVIGLNNAYQVYPWEAAKFHPANRLRVGLLRLFFRFSLRVADAVLVQTNLMGSYVRELTRDDKLVFVVPKAVGAGPDFLDSNLPAELAQKLEFANRNGFRKWLYVSTAMPHKNHRVLVDAFFELERRGSLDCLVLSITQEEALSIFGERVLDLVKSGRLIFTGWIKKDYLRSLYDGCDACLMPSLLESLSSAHLEAMEWGKPQIVADLPYARDLCGDAAIYVDPDNCFSWADAIQRLGDDCSCQEKLIINGKNRIIEYPRDWAECVRRIRSCLFSLLRK